MEMPRANAPVTSLGVLPRRRHRRARPPKNGQPVRPAQRSLCGTLGKRTAVAGEGVLDAVLFRGVLWRQRVRHRRTFWMHRRIGWRSCWREHQRDGGELIGDDVRRILGASLDGNARALTCKPIAGEDPG